MKIVLCTAPVLTAGDREGGELPVVPKLAIVSLMRWMTKFGYSCDFYDIDMLLPSNEEIFNYFKSKQPDVVGISAPLSISYLQVKNISKIIRSASPSAWIVLGGNMAASANVLLRKTEVEVCVLGDGEKPWVSILDYVSKYRTKKNMKKLLEIKGIAFLNEQDELEFTGYGEPIPIDEYPFPDYELLSKGLLSNSHLVENYYFREGRKCSLFNHDKRTYEPSRKPNMAIAGTSKGCVARCSFCQRFCTGYRVFDLKRIDDHLSELKEKYNVQFIAIGDEAFGVKRDHAYEVAKILKKHDMLWYFTGRCNSFTLEDFRFFSECGCTGVRFGVESGSQKILDIMEKRITVEDLCSAFKNTHECGMFSPLAFCVGMPGETDDTIRETGQFIWKIAQIQGVSPRALYTPVFYALPIPGTPLYDYGQLQGVIGNSVEEEEAFLIYTSDKGTTKDNFVNLTGISTKKTLLWDCLIYYEAMRAFYSAPIKNQKDIVRKKLDNNNKSLLRKVFWILPTPIISFIFTKIPRSIVFPIVQRVYYGKRFKRLKKIAEIAKIFQSVKNCKPIVEAKFLRKINQDIRESCPPPRTLTEKNRQMLRLGR